MEATKVRIQTAPGAPPTLRGCAPFIYKTEGLSGFYKGLPPLWMRQIPYTMMKVGLHFASLLKTLGQYQTRFCRVPKNKMSFIPIKLGPIYAVFCQIAY
jgi:solute carrier family 25 phosphate transporter 3